MLRIVLFFLIVFAGSPITPAMAAPSVGLYYGSKPPVELLRAFDIAVVEPDHLPDPDSLRHPASEPFAYLSLGEVHPQRPYFRAIPESWRAARNSAWGSVIIDQTAAGWAEFVEREMVGPLWAKGYRGFFLDTLDAYHAIPGDQAVAQQEGLKRVIRRLVQAYPGIRLIFNRGFELLPDLHGNVELVAAESLYRGYDAGQRRYVEVPKKDREWLKARLNEVKDRYGLPVLSIEYMPPGQRDKARELARQLASEGYIPWVTDGLLEGIGVGAVEAMPRRVLVLYDGRNAPVVDELAAQRHLSMPLQHLGYLPEFVDVQSPLPEEPLLGKVAGIVSWLDGEVTNPARLSRWLTKQVDQGLRIAVFGDFGLDPQRVVSVFRLTRSQLPSATPVVTIRDPRVGLEFPVKPQRHLLQPFKLPPDSDASWLRLRDPRSGTHVDAVAITPWGGFALAPFGLIQLPGSEQARWVVDPFAFLQESLRLPLIPVPDTTTESGRRLLMVHIDGDGYASRAEWPGSPLAGKALHDEILTRYKIPTTLSVIEGEVAPYGLYPAQSAEMEAIASKSFALPHVEIATHTYSHPFRWAAIDDQAPTTTGDEQAAYHLDLPGYRPTLDREISGSADYVRKLAPKGKDVSVMLWSGDAQPSERALAVAARAGLLAMNGGNTLMRRSFPSLTAVSPIGIQKGSHFHVLAPVMNENVYTNLWTGPFYGFENVIETFEMTESPRRLKPIGIYYHVYSASKTASLNALRKVYDWSIARPTRPVFASEFIRKAQAFPRFSIGRRLDGAFELRGDDDLRTVRLPPTAGDPDLTTSLGIAGHAPGPEGRYIHMAAPRAVLALGLPRGRAPHVRTSNARIDGMTRLEDGVRFDLRGHLPVEVELADTAGCQITPSGRPLPASKGMQHLRYDHAAITVRIRCPG